MKEGIVKVNCNFDPVVCFLNGSVLWGGTKRESLGYGFHRVDKKYHDIAFKFLGKNVYFKTIEDRFGETLAQLNNK